MIKTPAGVAEKLAKAVADGVADWDNLRSEGKIDVIYHPGTTVVVTRYFCYSLLMLLSIVVTHYCHYSVFPMITVLSDSTHL